MSLIVIPDNIVKIIVVPSKKLHTNAKTHENAKTPSLHSVLTFITKPF